jgi:penicillin amidase
MDCLEGQVEVFFDQAGIPHIYAKNDADGFRALGYLMAQDRLVQMAAMLKLARGELSEFVGKMALDTDRFLRTVGLGRTADRLVDNLEPDSLSCLESYCQGVNSYASRGALRLPFEFIFLKGRPEPWASSDCLTLGLFTTWLLDAFWPMDLTREKLIRDLGIERAMELLPETADYNNPPVKVRGGGPRAETLEPGDEVDWDFEGEPGGGTWLEGLPRAAFGSNNWVLSGKLTDTGKPILAGDPHIQHNVPGVLYLFHMVTPQRDVIGAQKGGRPVFFVNSEIPYPGSHPPPQGGAQR